MREQDVHLKKGRWTFAGIVVAAVVTVTGWFVIDWRNGERDLANDRRELRAQYLIETYRRLTDAADRECMSEQDMRNMEAAVADIQLLGTNGQIEMLRELQRTGSKDWGMVLGAIRDDLRAELQIGAEGGEIAFFRFPRKRRTIYDGSAACSRRSPGEQLYAPTHTY